MRIFISSPGDVAEDERALARELIDATLAKDPAFCERLQMRSISWDDPAARIPLEATRSPQESVNDALPRPAVCDIVIVILWKRMGSPLPDSVRKPNGERYLSGTEWEYEDAVSSPLEPKPGVYVYRRTEKPKLAIDDPEFEEKRAQYQHVNAFCSRIRSSAGVNDYPTPGDFKTLLEQHLRRLLHRFLPASEGRTARPPEEVVATIPETYCDWLRDQCADVSLLGQERQQGQALSLSNVYVPAMTRFYASIDDVPNLDAVRNVDEIGRIIPLLRWLDAESLYVPAPAGAGKSTFCRWAVLQSIAAATLAHPVPAPNGFAETELTNLRGRLPLLVPLREFGCHMPCGRGEREWRRVILEGALIDWIDAYPPDGMNGALFKAHLEAGSALLLLDGVDEVAVSETRDGRTVYPRALVLSGLADALPAWRQAGNRVLLTSRPYGVGQQQLQRLGLPVAELEPLPLQLQELFVRRWFHTLGNPGKADELFNVLWSDENLEPLAENPMLLTALCILYGNGGRLPENRYELYKSIVASVLHNRYPGDARERDPIERRLEAIALGMHAGGDGVEPRALPAAAVSWRELDHWLAQFAQLNPVYEKDQVEVSARREELLNHSGLLRPRAGERADFCHLSFQEFLAAQRLSRSASDIEQVFCQHCGTPEWWSTLLFLFAAQIAYRDAGWGIRLLERLLTHQDRAAVRAHPEAAAFVAKALEFCLTNACAAPADLEQRFRTLALEAIDDEVEVRSRLAIGLCLGRLGDPRVVSLRDPQAYVEVPAGVYPYGEEGGTVAIAQPFRIGRYPVTNSQFAEFIEAGGYRKESRLWWSEEGLKWLENAKVGEPFCWRDRRLNGPNQPVVGVNYWEAQACSVWAGGRLPTEEEWETAARGPNGFQYPWGDDWTVGVCNTGEAGQWGTLPVGLFPRSRQADFGVEDLNGNVFELCDSFDDRSDQNFRNGCVLRGGARYVSFARSLFRGVFYLGDRDSNTGFRVVCRPSPGTEA